MSAKRLLRECRDWMARFYSMEPQTSEPLIRRVDAYLAAPQPERDAVIEECARECDRLAEPISSMRSPAACAAAIRALKSSPSREGKDARRWLDNNTMFYDVRPDGANVPVLASVSKRIWYHATNDQKSYPFSAVVDAALEREGHATRGDKP